MKNTLHPVQYPQLTPYIKNYYVLDFSSLVQENIEVKVPPIGFPVLQFHFGDKANYYHHKHFTNQSLFIGQCSRHVMLFPSRGMKLLGINFKPYGLYNLFGLSPYGFVNSGVESSSFFGEDNVNYISQTLKTEGVDKGVEEIEALLLAFQNKNVKSQPYFDGLVDKMEAENGLINCADLLDKNVSVRTFQRYFKEVIGISPKLFCQVLRHKYVMELLYQNPEMKWCDMQLNGFYYDYSHFTKDFILFSGLTPQKYLPIKNHYAASLLNTE
ncbi:MAG: helix-turn-helix domain-containing protein [Bacteroidales bacterium]|nr:helix-turn-helix domain-containing protein [Bacteroidales bacterium]